jgi:hypothetical protein
MATNLAYRPDYESPDAVPFTERRLTVQVSENKRPWIMTVKPDPLMFELDTGLRADVRLTLPVSKDSKLPLPVLMLVERIKELELLTANWDSYAANPLDDRAVRAAMSLIVEAEKTGCSPDHLVPLSSGGLGLRWKSGSIELEVDIDPDKTCSAFFETQDNEADLARGSSLSKAMELIARFRRSR